MPSLLIFRKLIEGINIKGRNGMKWKWGGYDGSLGQGPPSSIKRIPKSITRNANKSGTQRGKKHVFQVPNPWWPTHKAALKTLGNYRP